MLENNEVSVSSIALLHHQLTEFVSADDTDGGDGERVLVGVSDPLLGVRCMATLM